MSGAADTAGVLVRPPLLFLGALVAGIAFDALIPAPTGWLDGWRWPVAAGLALAAFAIFIPAARRFRAHGTNIPTDRPTMALVTDGPYRRSRNPIYVALTLLYLALALAAGSAWAIGMIVPVLIVLRHGVIAREERYLEGKFGEDYRAYRARVRRWL